MCFFILTFVSFYYSDRVAFVWSLASVIISESFGRAGLMALSSCIASAAYHSDACKESEVCSVVKQENPFQESLLPCSAADLLDVLGIVIERSKQHFNSNYRLKGCDSVCSFSFWKLCWDKRYWRSFLFCNSVCEHILRAASSLINVAEIQLDMLLQFISTVPREFTDNGTNLP